ncbi:putative monovalent cation/H+ antiporter subunit G [Azotobacter vinelandii CA]|uniref:Sodium hydrogen antiporter subunitG, ShaG n=2 Tax=Azotobacter vinelandii TaxID=354 RepID=C1DEI2_AZOVD|nr:Na+/H+ antiporter subunit G [Azotobacter vinelandii]ACO78167.1 sodium hydrogen antiporter subunitG, ShaG [Azotobacter vinelandii DJ]AGK13128.1 putative monovalent cation/H+ antiporter subunit G [Azotobacter vinelandii CA]AGK18809.1 putative monovalent cation/H+ antiporter subunit G [Azotobacter vinelandii CA6]WKN23875.1 Na+/H+ antiporter subunit G [Azotobacter vinelandii]SFX55317.1 multisubunit potassium/proton antiporter, PhaG subunit [Azotobacter vinelandii]
MPFWIEALVSLFLVLGSLFALIGAIGLYRLPDFYTRLHAPTKATTLGVGGMVIASMLFFAGRPEGPSLHELLLTLFLFISAPVSAHMLARAALRRRLPVNGRTRGKPW